MKAKASNSTPRHPSRFRTAEHALTLVLMSSTAFAAGGGIGGGIISWAQPIILFLGLGAVVVGLVGAVFRPELVKGAVWAVVILVVIFFILRNSSALQSAIQAA